MQIHIHVYVEMLSYTARPVILVHMDDEIQSSIAVIPVHMDLTSESNTDTTSILTNSTGCIVMVSTGLHWAVVYYKWIW